MNASTSRRGAALASSALCLLGFACSKDPAPSAQPATAATAQRNPTPKPAVALSNAPTEKPPSFLLITCDTTRADRLGCYGYEKAETPNLDRIARAGVRFDRVQTSVPYTLPAHASLLTGVHPPEHGIRINATAGLPPDVATLPEAFHAKGYRTGAFVSAAVLDASFGLSRGFDTYDDDLGPSSVQTVVALQRTGEKVAEAALAWLEAEPARPFFCWVHFYDPHAAYEPPSPYRERHKDPYDGEIAYMDSQIGRLLSWLDARDLFSTTLVAAVADHGEGLGEHGEKTHGVLLYDATLHVPWVMSFPSSVGAGIHVATPVELIDVAPTVCALLGLDPLKGARGMSLVPALNGGQVAARPRYAESEYCKLNFGWGGLYAVSSGDMKYIEAPRPELYDLAHDPREEHDLAATDAEHRTALAKDLEKLRGSMRVHAATNAPVDPAMAQRLQGLGYAQGGGGDEESASVNPRDHIELVEEFHAAIGQGQRGKFENMIAPLEHVAKEFPNAVGFRTELGTAYFHAGRLADAQRELEAAIALDKNYYTAHYNLGKVFQEMQRRDDALREFAKTLELRPEFYIAHTNVVTVLVDAGQFEQAIAPARALVQAKPTDPSYRVGLASVLRNAGKLAEMKAAYEQALALHEAGVQISYAWELATNASDSVRDGARAVTLAEEVADAGGRDADTLDTLAAAYAEVKRFDDAVKTATEAAEAARKAEREDLAHAIEQRLALYRDKKPFRAP